MNNIPDKPQDVMFTTEQWQAIHASGTNLLLSASAGSGKTRVLVERVLAKIKKGEDIDRLLIVTFTRAAAKEMRDRIREEVQNQINETDDAAQQAHLVRQLSLLPQAQISTIHSFCSEVIRRFYYLIDFDPVFSMLTNETEIAILQDDIWAELRESYFSGDKAEDFTLLSSVFSSDRKDDGLTELVQKIYRQSQAQVDSKEWLERLDSLFEDDQSSFYHQPLWLELLQPQMLEILENNLLILSTALEKLEIYPELEKNIEIVEYDLNMTRQMLDFIRDNHFSKARAAALSWKEGSKAWSSVRKGISEEALDWQKEIKPLRDEAKKSLNEDLLDRYFIFPLDEQLSMAGEMKSYIEKLKRVVQDYTEAYQDYKSRRKLLDFNDLEHFTYQILNQTNEEGVCEARDYYRRAFSEVLIDEYQDTNVLQEKILEAVAAPDSEGGNRFMVGDVKQSIYRFRMAEPDLFMEKYDRYAGGEEGRRIILQENFRSRSDVVDFVNLLFMQVMDRRVGEMPYDGQAELVTGYQDFPESDLFQTELLIYTEEDDEEIDLEEEKLQYYLSESRKAEIVLAAQKIKDLVQGGFEIYDKELKSNRPVSYQDIVILTRKKSSNFDIQSIFAEHDIDTIIPKTENYFQTTEVSIMMAVLNIIDNPRQDIPLAAVLRSPVVNLDENDLARIRILNQTSDYYGAFMSFIHSEAAQVAHPDLHEKLVRFNEQLIDWREDSKRLAISELIWKIYNESGFMDYAGGMPNGKQRKANLHALYEHALDFEEMNQRGLYSFVRFIERMQERDDDLSEPMALAEGQEAVQVMTVHNSKGLEFPIVLLLGLSGKMTQWDYIGDVIVDKNYGLASKYIDPVQRIKTQTLQSAALANEIKRRSYSEEMRVLYVALTRAEQKLILIGNAAKRENIIKRWSEVEGLDDLVLPEDARLKPDNVMDWIGKAIYRHRDFEGDQPVPQSNSTVYGHPARFKLEFISRGDLIAKLLEETKEDVPLDWYKKLKEGRGVEKDPQVDLAVGLMTARYDYPLAVQTTSYQSVSEIKRVFEDPSMMDLLQLDASQPLGQNRYVIDELDRPKFITETTAASPAEIGMATHLLLQTLDFSRKPTLSDVQATLSQLVEERRLNRQVAERIRIDTVLNFLETDLAGRMVEQSDSLEREVSFSLKLPARQIFAGIDAGEDILVHGIADGYFEEEGELVLFDYKTDAVQRFGDRGIEIMLEKYRGQVNLYDLALENILEKRVKESYLVLLDTNQIVQVNQE